MSYITRFRILATWAAVALVAVPSLAQPKRDFSADAVMTQDNQTIGAMKLYVTGLKIRNENNMRSNTVTIVRKDRKVTWVLYPQQKVYIERPLDPRYQTGEIDLGMPGVISKEKVGSEQVLGYLCTKYKLMIQAPRPGRPLTAYIWWADSLGTGLKSEVMGIVSEYRNLRIGPQPGSLFELPPGYQRTESAPVGTIRMPKGMSPETARKLQEAMRNSAGKNR